MLFCKKQDGQQPRKNRGCLWTIIICLVIYVVLCGIIGAAFGSMFETPETKLTDNTVYKLEMSGVVVEQGQEENPFASLMSSTPYYNQPNTVGLNDLIANIRLAEGSDQVKGIYLYGGEFSIGQSSAKALRDALLDFKRSGKFIIAYAPSYSHFNYYIASVADSIYLNPTGSISWNGLSAQKMYFTRVLEKIGVEMQILKVGTFKSAVEPYFRTSMSDADRKQTEVYLNGIWNVLKEGVSLSRGISTEELDKLADRYMGVAPAEDYISSHLADRLVYADEMDSVLTRLAGKDYKLVSTAKMSNVKKAKSSAKDKIGILYLDGQIYSEEGDGIVDTKVLKTIKKMHKEKDLKAVVLRVNSPGGSADASEQIHHAVQTLQAKGLPVVVSMGDYAASGGYYISCEADYIYAEPNTLTGSIGIFGTIPNIKKLREKIGLDVDCVTTNRHSALDDNMLFQGMNPEEQKIMQDMIERGYDLFTRRCAEGRHLTQDSIKAIGEGRVWLGQDALNIGLVDALGNMDDAIKKAAQLAETEDYQLVYYPEKKDPMAELLNLLDNTTDEEKLILRIKEFASKPRIMALMPEVTIQ
ncbi:MAG: signal peptide peptidase SppA [Paludibacteraceae bacterium]|nr:signal peptide peptidase SppA [Paludibacteraceae bacterium]